MRTSQQHCRWGVKKGVGRQRKILSGFTLVELLVVIAIIGILAGMILGFSGYVTRKSDRSKAVADIEKLKNAVEEFKVYAGFYPTNNTSFTNNSDSSIVAICGYFTTNYAITSFTDPWGRGYEYNNLGTYQYKIWSYGPDRVDTNDNIDSTTGNY